MDPYLYPQYPLTLYIVRLTGTGGGQRVNVTTKPLRRIDDSPSAKYFMYESTGYSGREYSLSVSQVERGENPDQFAHDIVGLGLTRKDALRHAIKFLRGRIGYLELVRQARERETQLLVATLKLKHD